MRSPHQFSANGRISTSNEHTPRAFRDWLRDEIGLAAD
jgi:hypothetical protein